MKTQSQLLVIFLLTNFVLTGCTHSKSPTIVPGMENTSKVKGQLLTFDLKKLPDITTVKLSDIGATEIEYIPLKTTTKTVIPPIWNIIFSKNYFLTNSSSCINMFRYDGTFVIEIGTNGRGPNEYLSSDVAIDPKNESIYIGDGRQSKFLVIDKDGKVVRTFKSPQTGYMTSKFVKDGILCYYDNFAGNIENSFILIDSTGKTIKNFPNKYPLESSDRGISYGSEIIFYNFNNQIFKKEIYCDTIFLFNNKVFEPHLIIDVGGLSLTPHVRTSANGKSFSEVNSILSKILLPNNLFEFSDFIFYSFGIPLNGKHDSFSFIGSKKNSFRAMFPNSEGFVNDFDGGPNIIPKAVKDDKTIVSWIDAFEFKKYFSSDAFKNSTPEYPEKKKELEKLASYVKENDNPILIFIKVR